MVTYRAAGTGLDEGRTGYSHGIPTAAGTNYLRNKAGRPTAGSAQGQPSWISRIRYLSNGGAVGTRWCAEPGRRVRSRTSRRLRAFTVTVSVCYSCVGLLTLALGLIIAAFSVRHHPTTHNHTNRRTALVDPRYHSRSGRRLNDFFFFYATQRRRWRFVHARTKHTHTHTSTTPRAEISRSIVSECRQSRDFDRSKNALLQRLLPFCRLSRNLAVFLMHEPENRSLPDRSVTARHCSRSIDRLTIAGDCHTSPVDSAVSSSLHTLAHVCSHTRTRWTPSRDPLTRAAAHHERLSRTRRRWQLPPP